MLQIDLTFHETAPDSHGFKLGDMEIRGDKGGATSKMRTPSKSMMLVLSIVELLDGIRRFLSKPGLNTYEFIGVDSSFSVLFRKRRKREIEVLSEKVLIHISDPTTLKNDVEESVTAFLRNNDLAYAMNKAEAADFNCALNEFREFVPM